MALIHSSGYATRDPLGASVAANTPVYDATAAYGAAPAAPLSLASVTAGAGASCLCIGSGVWADATPVGIMFRTTGTTGVGNGVIRVGIGSGWTTNDFNTGTAATANALTNGTGKRVFEWDICCAAGDLGGANKGNGGNVDLLRGAGAANGEAADLRFEPITGFCAHGLLTMWCRVRRFTGTWDSVASALCQYDDVQAKWKLVYQAPDSGGTKIRGSQWNNTYWTAPDKTVVSPTEVWSAFVDYVDLSVASDTHVVVLMRATRPSTTSSVWTVQATEVFRITADAGNQHLHSAIITPLGIVICQGHRGDASVILLDWSAAPWTWTGGAASSNDGTTQNGWTTRLNFSGFRSGTFANIRRHNMYMGVAPIGKSHRDFVVASDIGTDPMSRMTLPTVGTNKPKFTVIRAGRGTSSLSSNASYEVYGISCNDNHTPTAYISMKVGAASSGRYRRSILTNLTVAANSPGAGQHTMTRTSGSWLEEGWVTGRTVQVSGFPNAGNNGTFTVNAVTATVMTVTGNGFTESISGATVATVEDTEAFSAYTDIQKIIYSRDGANWSQLYACTAGIFREPKCVGEQVFFTANVGGNPTMQVLNIPNQAVGRPMVVAGAVTNYALTTPVISAVGGTNSLTDVTATYTNANALANGHTVPPCPSTNAVFYAQSDASNITIGNLAVTGNAASETIPQGRPRIAVWVYVLPASEPFVNHTTAPYDQLSVGNTATIRIIRRHVGGGAGDYNALDCLLIDTQGAGWTKYILSPEIGNDAAWTASLSRYVLGILADQTNVNTASFLISCESVVIGNTDATLGGHLRLTEFPLKPLPGLAAPGSAAYFSDTIETIGFNCGLNWSIALALQVPDTGPDQYTHATRPTSRRLATLRFAGTNAAGSAQSANIAVSYDVVNRRFSFTDGSNTTTLAAPSGQQFEFGRDAQIGIAISRAPNTEPNSTMNFAVFVGGSLVNTTTASWTGRVLPNRVTHADTALGTIDPHLVHAVYVDEDNALSQTALGDLLRSGSVLTVREPSRNSSTIIID
jgi:hypothetical protein